MTTNHSLNQHSNSFTSFKRNTLSWLWAILFSFCISSLHAQEICTNGIDDDGDSLIDLNDTTDCTCNSVSSIASLIPNPSFEDYDCLPQSFSELACADTWEQATYATSDFFINLPGSFWDPIIPMPVPDGAGLGGFIISSYTDDFSGMDTSMYNEYIGGCLLAPMQAGVEYTLQMQLSGSSWSGTSSSGVFYGPIDITIFGNPTCPIWPIALDPFSIDYGCPLTVDGWVELGHSAYQSDETWQTLTIQFTPSTDIQAIMIGGPCEVPEDFVVNYSKSIDSPYFWVDDLILNESSLFSSIQTTGNICTENLILTGTTDSPATSFQWYQEGIAIASQTNINLPWSDLNLVPGEYQFSAFLNDSVCAVSSIEIELPTPIPPLISAIPQTGCAPLTVEFTNITNPTSVTSSWSFSDGSTLEGNSVVHTFTESGFYDISIEATFEDGCAYDSTYNNYIEVYALPNASFTGTPQPTTVNDTQITLSAIDETGIDEWSWNLGSVEPFTSNESNPTITFPNTPGAYPVELIVINEAGCADTSQNFIFIDPSGAATLPNVFSPNGDGYNDRFVPFEEYPGNWTMTIYNRWGTDIFSTNSITNGWNGSDAPAGTYYWIITPLENQEGEIKSGHVTLIREK